MTSVALDLAQACLDLGDPARASKAVAQGLLCSTTNFRLRSIDLRIGALGGIQDLGRRLEAARAARWPSSPRTSQSSRPQARELGWAALAKLSQADPRRFPQAGRVPAGGVN